MSPNTPTILLASSSPRRQDLLSQVQIKYRLAPISIDETPKTNQDGSAENAVRYVERMAFEKNNQAQQVYGKEAIIITADTIGKIAIDNHEHILIKPNNLTDAKRMWQMMSANTHDVITSVCVSFKGRLLQATASTQVEFIHLTEAMMQAYWQTEEPIGKAGAYAIQGIGASWVKTIHGSYANVVGLPLVETIELIEKIQTT